MTNQATETTDTDRFETASPVPATSPRTARWPLGMLVVLTALSTMVSWLILSTSMAWSVSQPACAEVAVTVAVNPYQPTYGHLLEYQITAGHNHGPPPTIDVPRSTLHTYYVLAGDTPVLVHNCNAGPPSRFAVDSNGVATDLRPGLVEGPAPRQAYDMLAMVDARPGGIGKVPGYGGNASYANRSGALPAGVKYREWELYPEGSLSCPRGCGGTAPGPERIVTELGGSAAYYTPDHYGTFFRIR